jgi:selenocysteine lyase/cysteine desulfurase
MQSNLLSGHLDVQGCPNGKFFILLDAAKSAQSSLPDLSVHPVHFLCMSYYKVFGMPSGIGALIVRRDCLPMLRAPFLGGGALTSTLPATWPCSTEPRPDPAQFEAGTPNFQAIVQLPIGFHMWHSVALMEGGLQRSHCLSEQLAQQLSALQHPNGRRAIELFGWCVSSCSGCLPNALIGIGEDLGYVGTVLGDATRPSHGPVVPFNVWDAVGEPVSCQAVAEHLVQCNVIVRAGCCCNPGACAAILGYSDATVREMHAAGWDCGKRMNGVLNGRHTGIVRASLGIMSTLEDVEALVTALSTALEAGLWSGKHWAVGCAAMAASSPVMPANSASNSMMVISDATTAASSQAHEPAALLDCSVVPTQDLGAGVVQIHDRRREASTHRVELVQPHTTSARTQPGFAHGIELRRVHVVSEGLHPGVAAHSRIEQHLPQRDTSRVSDRQLLGQGSSDTSGQDEKTNDGVQINIAAAAPNKRLLRMVQHQLKHSVGAALSRRDLLDAQLQLRCSVAGTWNMRSLSAIQANLTAPCAPTSYLRANEGHQRGPNMRCMHNVRPHVDCELVPVTGKLKDCMSARSGQHLSDARGSEGGTASLGSHCKLHPPMCTNVAASAWNHVQRPLGERMHLAALLVYPVKSCGGFSANAWPVTQAGLFLDRAFMLIDHSGSALSPHCHPKLSQLAARLDLDQAELELRVHSRRHTAHVCGSSGACDCSGNGRQTNCPVSNSTATRETLGLKVDGCHEAKGVQSLAIVERAQDHSPGLYQCAGRKTRATVAGSDVARAGTMGICVQTNSSQIEGMVVASSENRWLGKRNDGSHPEGMVAQQDVSVGGMLDNSVAERQQGPTQACKLWPWCEPMDDDGHNGDSFRVKLPEHLLEGYNNRAYVSSSAEYSARAVEVLHVRSGGREHKAVLVNCRRGPSVHDWLSRWVQVPCFLVCVPPATSMTSNARASDNKGLPAARAGDDKGSGINRVEAVDGQNFCTSAGAPQEEDREAPVSHESRRVPGLIASLGNEQMQPGRESQHAGTDSSPGRSLRWLCCGQDAIATSAAAKEVESRGRHRQRCTQDASQRSFNTTGELLVTTAASIGLFAKQHACRVREWIDGSARQRVRTDDRRGGCVGEELVPASLINIAVQFRVNLVFGQISLEDTPRACVQPRSCTTGAKSCGNSSGSELGVAHAEDTWEHVFMLSSASSASGSIEPEDGLNANAMCSDHPLSECCTRHFSRPLACVLRFEDAAQRCKAVNIGWHSGLPSNAEQVSRTLSGYRRSERGTFWGVFMSLSVD